MQTESTHDYHMRRARAEFDLAYRAEGWAATEAHLKLSALHMARLCGAVTGRCVPAAAVR